MIQNALFLCVVCALVFVFYLPSYVKMQDLHEKNHVYEKRISDLEKDNVRLEEERRRLTDDPAYFEKVARERMGIIRDGEVIYKVLNPGQKKDGKDSQESSFIVKQEKDDPAGKSGMAVSSAATLDLKPAAKPKDSKKKKSKKKSSKSSATKPKTDATKS